MKTINNELITFFDVDSTIIFDTNEATIDTVTYLDVTGRAFLAKPHKVHIDQMRKHKARGYTVIVWSGNGYQHAENVVKALGLENYVDYCMSKAVKYWDDLEDANQILTSRVYLEDK